MAGYWNINRRRGHCHIDSGLAAPRGPEQRRSAEWALADKAQSYDGKFCSGDDAKGLMAAWRDGVRKQ